MTFFYQFDVYFTIADGLCQGKAALILRKICYYPRLAA